MLALMRFVVNYIYIYIYIYIQNWWSEIFRIHQHFIWQICFMGTDDLPPNPLKQALNYNTRTQIHITSVQYYKQQYMQYQAFMRDIYISKGLQCALTAITIVALWQLPHLGRGMYKNIQMRTQQFFPCHRDSNSWPPVSDTVTPLSSTDQRLAH